MKERLANGLTLVMAASAVALTALAVHNQIPRTRSGGSAEIREVEDWKALTREGNVLGRPDAPVQIVEFSDFQCPFCADSHRALREVRRKYVGQVAVVYRHSPLPGHRYALPAAVASECAAEQGAFEPYHDLLFEQQDSIGIKPWDRFAQAAGVGDVGRFRTCLESGRAARRIQRDLRVVSKLGARGTPTFIVNGRMFTGTISATQWDSWIRNTLQSR